MYVQIQDRSGAAAPGEEAVVLEAGFAVGERGAGQGLDAAAGGFENGLTGRPCSTSAISTANSALRATNSRVPSSGSIAQKRSQQGGIPSDSHNSSAMQGMSGKAAISRSTMIRSAARSASVTGVLSLLWRTSNSSA